MTIQIDPKDLTRLTKAINRLDNIECEYTIKKSLMKVAEEFRKEVEPKVPMSNGRYKAGVKVAGGNLKKSLSKMWKKNVKKGYMAARVGYKRPGGNPAHLVDLGTQERYTKKGLYRGKVTPRKFHSGTFKAMEGQLSRDLLYEMTKTLKDIWEGKK